MENLSHAIHRSKKNRIQIRHCFSSSPSVDGHTIRTREVGDIHNLHKQFANNMSIVGIKKNAMKKKTSHQLVG